MSKDAGLLREALPGLDALLVLDAASAGRIIAERPDVWAIIRAALAAETVQHPGRRHEFHAVCLLCGGPGYINLSIIGPDEVVKIEPIPALADGEVTE